jgi:paraquat-inducible protein B
VRVSARLSRQAAGLLAEDSRFWVVKARVSGAGVTAIGTLITGAYIAIDPGTKPSARRAYAGLEGPPSIVSDRVGRRFVLRGEQIGSLAADSPVYLRGLQVGQVTKVGVASNAEGAVMEIFVDAPHHLQVQPGTRFWNASGVDLTVSAQGIKLDTQSLKSVLVGGIAFQTPVGPAVAPAPADAAFPLYATREAAFRHPGATASYLLVFSRPVRRLSPGAPVELLGLEVGEVAAVDVDFHPQTAEPRTLVTVALQPDRLRLRPGSGAEPGRDPSRMLLDRLVQRGLRGRVRSDNLLTGQRSIAFEMVAGAAPARIDWQQRTPELPIFEQGGAADNLPEAVGRLAARLEKLPLEQLAREGARTAQEMRRTLEGTTRLVDRLDNQLAPQMGALMGQANRTLGSMERTLSAQAPLQQDMRTALRDLSGAGYALRSLAEYLERHPESLIRGKKEDRP